MTSHQILISCTDLKHDQEITKKLYDDLRQNGLSPWLSSQDLLPGQNRKLTIRHEIENSAYVLVLLSSGSIRTRGMVQRELKIALDILDEFPADAIFVIPVRLDDCDIPYEQLQDREGLRRILKVVTPHAASGEIPEEPASTHESRGSLTCSSPSSRLPPGPIRNRWALLVGVNNYIDPAFRPLRFCDVDAMINALEFFRDGNAYFTGVWVQAEKGEPSGQTNILRALAQSESGMTAEELAQQAQSSRENLDKALETLTKHDVVKKDNAHIQFTVELMRRWVYNTKGMS